MAKAAKPAIPAKPTAVARAPTPELLDDGGDEVVAAAPEPSLVVAVAVVPVVTVPPEDDPAFVDWVEMSAKGTSSQTGALHSRGTEYRTVTYS